MKTITVSLPDDFAANIGARVARGEYESVDEAVTSAVAEWLSILEMPSPINEETSNLREKIQKSIDQYDRGEFVDGEEFLDRLERKFEQRTVDAVKVS